MNAEFPTELQNAELKFILDYKSQRKALYQVWRAQCLVDYAIMLAGSSAVFIIDRGQDPNEAFEKASKNNPKGAKLSLDETPGSEQTE
jgi:hypothetical protein